MFRSNIGSGPTARVIAISLSLLSIASAASEVNAQSLLCQRKNNTKVFNSGTRVQAIRLVTGKKCPGRFKLIGAVASPADVQKLIDSASNDGVDGAAGATGATGPIGPVGPMGLQGVAGAQGVAGQAGATGPVGPSGQMGLQGVPGVQGISGQVGATGPAGPSGAPGEAAAIGATGATGPAGVTGPRGATGPQGTQGIQGAQGQVGPAGAVGPQGPAGASFAGTQVGPALISSLQTPTAPAGCSQATIGCQGSTSQPLALPAGAKYMLVDYTCSSYDGMRTSVDIVVGAISVQPCSMAGTQSGWDGTRFAVSGKQIIPIPAGASTITVTVSKVRETGSENTGFQDSFARVTALRTFQ